MSTGYANRTWLVICLQFGVDDICALEKEMVISHELRCLCTLSTFC